MQSVELNGKPYDLSYIKHSDIMNGGTLVFEGTVKNLLNCKESYTAEALQDKFN